MRNTQADITRSFSQRQAEVKRKVLSGTFIVAVLILIPVYVFAFIMMPEYQLLVPLVF